MGFAPVHQAKPRIIVVIDVKIEANPARLWDADRIETFEPCIILVSARQSRARGVSERNESAQVTKKIKKLGLWVYAKPPIFNY